MTVSIGLGRVGSHKMDPWTTLSDPRSLRRTLHANCAVWQTCRLSSSSTPFRFDARAARSTDASRHRRRPRLRSLRSSRRRPHISAFLSCYNASTPCFCTTKTAVTRAALFDSNVHQIVCRLGLRPRPHWGSLQHFQGPLAAFNGPASKGRGRGEESNVLENVLTGPDVR